MEPSALKALYLVANGTKTELKRTGYIGWNNSYAYSFETDAAISPQNRITVEIYDQMQDFIVPFKLENISLLGVPLDGK